jgi:hypothetical protein
MLDASDVVGRGLMPTADSGGSTMLVWTPVGLALGDEQVAEGGGPSFEILLRRLRAEFTEMPGLLLTAAQAERLCGAPRHECERALEQLARDGVLRRLRDGAFVRA